MDSVITRVQELLKPFKTSENSTSLTFVTSDPEAIKILSIWPNLPVLLNDPLAFGGPPEHKPNLWKYIWKFRRIDYRDIEKRTGIEDRRKLQEKIDLLISHQLIYPDGTISRPAQTLIASR